MVLFDDNLESGKQLFSLVQGLNGFTFYKSYSNYE